MPHKPCRLPLALPYPKIVVVKVFIFQRATNYVLRHSVTVQQWPLYIMIVVEHQVPRFAHVVAVVVLATALPAIRPADAAAAAATAADGSRFVCPRESHRSPNNKHCFCDAGFACTTPTASQIQHCSHNYTPNGGVGQHNVSGFRRMKCPDCVCEAVLPTPPLVAPLPLSGPFLVLKRFQKSASEDLHRKLLAAIPGDDLAVLVESEPVLPCHPRAGFVISSIREPCSWQVSCWAYRSSLTERRGALAGAGDAAMPAEVQRLYGTTPPAYDSAEVRCTHAGILLGLCSGS